MKAIFMNNKIKVKSKSLTEGSQREVKTWKRPKGKESLLSLGPHLKMLVWKEY